MSLEVSALYQTNSGLLSDAVWRAFKSFLYASEALLFSIAPYSEAIRNFFVIRIDEPFVELHAWNCKCLLAMYLSKHQPVVDIENSGESLTDRPLRMCCTFADRSGSSISVLCDRTVRQ